MKINVLLCGGRKVTREGLGLLLEKQPDLQVIAEAEDTSALAKLVGALPVGVVVLIESSAASIAMRDIAGALGANPQVRILLLALNPPARWVMNMLKAGAMGCLTKECTGEEFVAALRATHAGQVYLSAALVHRVVSTQVGPKAKTPALRSLAPRAREILRRIADGQMTKQIAAELGIGAKTVETHRRRIMAKLNLFTVAELTKHALRQGLTTLEMEL